MNYIYLSVAIILLLIVSLVIFLHKKNRKTSSSSNLPLKSRIPAEYAIPDMPVSFGYKCKWLAVYTQEPQKLADWLGLKDAACCNWKNGIEYAYQDRVFISPPVEGWSFVISSRQLLDAENEENIKLIKKMLIDLSKEFSQAQYFGTYRVVGYDCWMKAEKGQIERAYGYVDGENTIVEGEPTAVEMKYNLINTFSEESKSDPDYFNREDLEFPDESITMEVAGAWSVNPQDLDEKRGIEPGLGLVGILT